jgi:hypothetical protein
MLPSGADWFSSDDLPSSTGAARPSRGWTQRTDARSQIPFSEARYEAYRKGRSSKGFVLDKVDGRVAAVAEKPGPGGALWFSSAASGRWAPLGGRASSSGSGRRRRRKHCPRRVFVLRLNVVLWKREDSVVAASASTVGAAKHRAGGKEAAYKPRGAKRLPLLRHPLVLKTASSSRRAFHRAPLSGGMLTTSTIEKTGDGV